MKPSQLIKATGCTSLIASKWCEHLNATMELYGIDSNVEQAHFIAQVAHESGNFKLLVENLNYSAIGLAKTWPKRFADTKGLPNLVAQRIAYSPKDIANICYANRMGNGDIESGDGFKYRGRGLIQLTGRDMYKLCGQALGIDLLTYPDLLTQPKEASLSAGWYWRYRGLDKYDDGNDVKPVTKLINGGLIGIAHREELFKKALAAFK